MIRPLEKYLFCALFRLIKTLLPLDLLLVLTEWLKLDVQNVFMSSYGEIELY